MAMSFDGDPFKKWLVDTIPCVNLMSTKASLKFSSRVSTADIKSPNPRGPRRVSHGAVARLDFWMPPQGDVRRLEGRLGPGVDHG